MIKTNKGLVEYARKALSEKWGYVWGTFGSSVLDENLLKAKIAQYPTGVGDLESIIRAKWMGRKVTDCVGLIKSYLWWDGSRVRYSQSTDTSADGMIAKAKDKGPISTIPDLPGICVWKHGHIGVYVGDGRVIEANGTRTGVIQTPLKGHGSTSWTHWLKCPWIEYVQEEGEGDMDKVKVVFYGKQFDGILTKDGVSYVPVRDAAEAFGGKVAWDESTKTVTVK